MMTAEELRQAQKDIQKETFRCAEECKKEGDFIEPIYDGVYDVEKYLASSPRIMWILKEPYDDFTSEGKPTGGGWAIYDCFTPEKAWKCKTWHRVIYATYGIINHCKYDKNKRDLNMAEVLQQIAYINISKIPAFSQSIDRDIQSKYRIWRLLLIKQISTYNPQILIFGNTFKYFKSDLIGNNTEPQKRIDGVIDIYKKEEKLFLDAYHPQSRLNEELYVNSIIENCINI